MVRQAAGTCVKRRDGEVGDGSWARVAVGTGQGGALGQRNNAVVGARWVPSTPSWGRSGARKGEVGRRKKREVRSERPGCGAGAALRCGGCGSLTSRWGRLGFVGRRGRLGRRRGALMAALMRRLYSGDSCRVRRRACRGGELGAVGGEVGSRGCFSVVERRDVERVLTAAAHSAGVWRSNAVKAQNINQFG
jgi:hypothetical protein